MVDYNTYLPNINSFETSIKEKAKNIFFSIDRVVWKIFSSPSESETENYTFLYKKFRSTATETTQASRRKSSDAPPLSTEVKSMLFNAQKLFLPRVVELLRATWSHKLHVTLIGMTDSITWADASFVGIVQFYFVKTLPFLKSTFIVSLPLPVVLLSFTLFFQFLADNDHIILCWNS